MRYLNQNDILSYVYSFVNFVIRDVDIKQIDKIILFGSAATGNLTKESDIDIFIDTKGNVNTLIKNAIEKFYKSNEFMLFKLKGIENEFSVKAGELKGWKELHRSISSSGIALYSKYEPKELPVGTKHEIIFYWDRIGKNRGAFLNKTYGYTIKGKKYSGLLEKWNGKRLGKSCIIVPFDKRDEMVQLIKIYKVNAKNIEAFSLE